MKRTTKPRFRLKSNHKLYLFQKNRWRFIGNVWSGAIYFTHEYFVLTGQSNWK